LLQMCSVSFSRSIKLIRRKADEITEYWEKYIKKSFVDCILQVILMRW